MIYFLIVVAVGGTTTITGPFSPALLLGVADVAGKYYVPAIGGFIIYTIMVAVLIFRPQGLFARVTAADMTSLAAGARVATADRRCALVAKPAGAGRNSCSGSSPSRSSGSAEPHLLFNEIAILGAARVVDRSRSRLCRHRHARPGRVLRPWRLYRWADGQARQGTFPWSDPLLGLLGAARCRLCRLSSRAFSFCAAPI